MGQHENLGRIFHSFRILPAARGEVFQKAETTTEDLVQWMGRHTYSMAFREVCISNLITRPFVRERWAFLCHFDVRDTPAESVVAPIVMIPINSHNHSVEKLDDLSGRIISGEISLLCTTFG